MAAMNAARLTDTWPLVTDTPAAVFSPVRAATRPAWASRFAATQASWKVLDATRLLTWSSVKP